MRCPFGCWLQVLDKDGKVVPHLYCIGDANGKYMLAHAASAQGISAVENMCGRPHVLNHLSVPAACFTHPEVPLRMHPHWRCQWAVSALAMMGAAWRTKAACNRLSWSLMHAVCAWCR